jgi:hypothetical protein
MAFVLEIWRARFLGLGFVGFFVPGIAWGQAPPEVAEITACLCMSQAASALAADMNTKTQTLDATNRQVADLNAQLARERSTINANNPDAVANFKALLERRDAAYHQSVGPVFSAASQATARYNAQISEYNARCANRPFNSALVAQLQPTLRCPPVP